MSSHRSKKFVASSSPSKASSSASYRLKASARKAALAGEAATLKRRQAMELEEFMLQQRKDDLRIEIELAKADGEERVYCKRDNPASIISATRLPASFGDINQTELCMILYLFHSAKAYRYD